MDDKYLECGRCGRKLIDSKSRERGYGPVCWEKFQREREEDGHQMQIHESDDGLH
ncbi:DUF6011 domain-containing protein [Halobacillus litoralis]|uniref:DUF6011 domain-containing protein n=1 Tax=Halobacillus litoralis TaxID=45668 RepID=UPI0013E8DD25|nr:DUF6011 domain-containing protein [Halobacillus litoralis]